METLARFQGCLLGLAIGDAVGASLEFKPKGSFTPITDMIGGGPFHLKPGSGRTTRQWPYAWPAAYWPATDLTPMIRCCVTAAGGMRVI